MWKMARYPFSAPENSVALLGFRVDQHMYFSELTLGTCNLVQ